MLVFTKSDKLGAGQLHKNIAHYQQKLLEEWEELPMSVVSSAKKALGREEILALIGQMNSEYGKS